MRQWCALTLTPTSWTAPTGDHDSVFHEFVCDESLELQQSHVQGLAVLKKALFLCGAGGSSMGWAAGGPADMLSRSSSTTRSCYCLAPHSLCPLQSANHTTTNRLHLHPLLLSLTLQGLEVTSLVELCCSGKGSGLGFSSQPTVLPSSCLAGSAGPGLV
ncbi:unnamed protein product [Pleuronectes platessa]|uniref:Uncharacterized protein n=1 Tax=Pleuronectes platessa TaxID=8262 RepID=A0A9N7VKF6_PLEPL|nr:unnamed protein product [Pleuronectes platessa]